MNLGTFTFPCLLLRVHQFTVLLSLHLCHPFPVLKSDHGHSNNLWHSGFFLNNNSHHATVTVSFHQPPGFTPLPVTSIPPVRTKSFNFVDSWSNTEMCAFELTTIRVKTWNSYFWDKRMRNDQRLWIFSANKGWFIHFKGMTFIISECKMKLLM